MGEFLKKWVEPPATPPETVPAGRLPENGEARGERAGTDEAGVMWAEWKAAALNQLFREQGVTGQPGRITAATIRHGEANHQRKSGGVSPVDCAATDEQPISRAEVPAE